MTFANAGGEDGVGWIACTGTCEMDPMVRVRRRSLRSGGSSNLVRRWGCERNMASTEYFLPFAALVDSQPPIIGPTQTTTKRNEATIRRPQVTKSWETTKVHLILKLSKNMTLDVLR